MAGGVGGVGRLCIVLGELPRGFLGRGCSLEGGMVRGMLLRNRGCLFGGGGCIFWGVFGRTLVFLFHDCHGSFPGFPLLRDGFCDLYQFSSRRVGCILIQSGAGIFCIPAT